MNKQLLLSKLEKLNIPEKDLNTVKKVISWKNKVAPLLKYCDIEHYYNFIQFGHYFDIGLSSYSLKKAIIVMRGRLQMAIEELRLRIEMEEDVPKEMYFSENSYLDVQKAIAKVIALAEKSLWVYDPYMDEKIIEELTNIPGDEVKLLTKEKPPQLFYNRLQALNKQKPNMNVVVKQSSVSHDRWYIIDEEKVWTFGASFKDGGKRATFLSMVKNDQDAKKIIEDFNKWWNSAEELVN